MKRILLIIISVIMLFTACRNQTDSSVEESVQTQINPAEEFGDIIFGMTQEELSNTLSQEDDADYDEIEKLIACYNQTFFNVSNASIFYAFDDYNKFYYIFVYYSYSNHQQALGDYAVIKETVLKNYPPKSYNPKKYDYGEDDLLDYNTENRSIYLRLLDNKISLHISVAEQISSDYDENAET